MSGRAERLLAALRGTPASLVTLPRRGECPVELVKAIGRFDAGERPAAVTTAAWLRSRALDEYGSARTYVWVAAGEVLAFFTLSVGLGKLEPAELEAADANERRPLPAVLLAQAARRPDADLPPGAILEYALGIAARVEEYVGVGALMLDPFDPETEAMWISRGCRPTRDKPRNGVRRLWMPL